jgi:hypothetical protein
VLIVEPKKYPALKHFSAAVRQMLEYFRRLTQFLPESVFAWDKEAIQALVASDLAARATQAPSVVKGLAASYPPGSTSQRCSMGCSPIRR